MSDVSDANGRSEAATARLSGSRRTTSALGSLLWAPKTVPSCPPVRLLPGWPALRPTISAAAAKGRVPPCLFGTARTPRTSCLTTLLLRLPPDRTPVAAAPPRASPGEPRARAAPTRAAPAPGAPARDAVEPGAPTLPREIAAAGPPAARRRSTPAVPIRPVRPPAACSPPGPSPTAFRPPTPPAPGAMQIHRHPGAPLRRAASVQRAATLPPDPSGPLDPIDSRSDLPIGRQVSSPRVARILPGTARRLAMPADAAPGETSLSTIGRPSHSRPNLRPATIPRRPGCPTPR